MSETNRSVLVGKVVSLSKRHDLGGLWPFYGLVLDFREGLLHVRSLDKNDADRSFAYRDRHWIPTNSIGYLQVLTAAMIEEYSGDMLPREQWEPKAVATIQVPPQEWLDNLERARKELDLISEQARVMDQGR